MNINYFVENCNKTLAKMKPSKHLPLFELKSEIKKNELKTVNFEHLRPETILMISYKIENAG